MIKLMLLTLFFSITSLSGHAAEVCDLKSMDTVQYQGTSQWTGASKFSELERLGVVKNAEDEAMWNCEKEFAENCQILRSKLGHCRNGSSSFSSYYTRYGECNGVAVAVGCKDSN